LPGDDPEEDLDHVHPSWMTCVDCISGTRNLDRGVAVADVLPAGHGADQIALWQ
jgi:hypothetical protein